MSTVFATELTVRGYECGLGGVVSVPTLLSYCEHCRWLWISEPTLGLRAQLDDGYFFVVHKARVGLYRSFGIGTRLTVRATLRSVGRVHCEVEQDLVRDDGVVLGRAFVHALWIGPSGRLRRVPQATRDAAVGDVLESIDDAPPRVPETWRAPEEVRYAPTLEPRNHRDDPPPDATRTPHLVRPSDCDMFEHMNNAVYLRLIEDVLDTPIVDADIEYRKQAKPGDALVVHHWATDAGTAVALTRDDDVICRAMVTPRR